MARQGETAARDERPRYIVAAFVVDLSVLVRQAAMKAVREALGQVEVQRRAQRVRIPGRKRTRAVELVPAAAPKAKREPKADAEEPVMPAPRAGDTNLMVKTGQEPSPRRPDGMRLECNLPAVTAKNSAILPRRNTVPSGPIGGRPWSQPGTATHSL